MLDEQAEQIFAITDDLAGRARKTGGTTMRSIADIARWQRLCDNDAENLAAAAMPVLMSQ